MWLLPAILLMVLLGGCIVYYEKPGQTLAEFDRDKKYCEGIAEQEYVPRGTKVCEEIDRCLISKGWKHSQ